MSVNEKLFVGGEVVEGRRDGRGSGRTDDRTGGTDVPRLVHGHDAVKHGPAVGAVVSVILRRGQSVEFRSVKEPLALSRG
jgi:hypothetical protein